jgi:phosphoribosylformylglycinamidine synthase
MGILPSIHNNFYHQTVSLIGNDSGRYEDRWVTLKVHESPCIWTKGYKSTLEVPVRHGEGKFVTKNQDVLRNLWKQNFVALSYSPATYPNNPNGSVDGIAGICDKTGRIFGLMPHPECHVMKYHHPHWTRNAAPEENGLKIFENGVQFARAHL